MDANIFKPRNLVKLNFQIGEFGLSGKRIQKNIKNNLTGFQPSVFLASDSVRHQTKEIKMKKSMTITQVNSRIAEIDASDMALLEKIRAKNALFKSVTAGVPESVVNYALKQNDCDSYRY